MYCFILLKDCTCEERKLKEQGLLEETTDVSPVIPFMALAARHRCRTGHQICRHSLL